jgi:hypothetical protein
MTKGNRGDRKPKVTLKQYVTLDNSQWGLGAIDNQITSS